MQPATPPSADPADLLTTARATALELLVRVMRRALDAVDAVAAGAHCPLDREPPARRAAWREARAAAIAVLRLRLPNTPAAAATPLPTAAPATVPNRAHRLPTPTPAFFSSPPGPPIPTRLNALLNAAGLALPAA